MLRALALLVPAALLSIAACGSDNASSGSSETCESIQDEARAPISKAIDANKACTTDADCVDVAYATSCFDSCSRGIAKSGAAAVDAAKDDAEKNACTRFKAKGCKVIIPPCPPPDLRCLGGKCES